ncbi:hypothetical protein [Rhodococcoides trifolii]|uniref:hypothetical protein n=1 Tax=Rhodococcoides trifolii TaxID=908250 RepID=UPI001665E0E6|nr:hypothetical protein [Rhodococcus trifolii]
MTATLVDPELPQLGAVDERVTPLRPESGMSVGDVVAAAVGVMSLRAERNDLRIRRTTVAYSSAAQRDSIVSSFDAQKITGVALADASNPELDSTLATPVAVAVWGIQSADTTTFAAIKVPRAQRQPDPSRRGLALVAGGIAAAVVAGGVAVWAVAGTRGPESTGSSTPLTSETSTVAPTTTVPVPAPALPPAPVAPPVTTDPDTGEVYSVDPNTGEIYTPETYDPETYTENPYTGETYTEETVPQANVRTPSTAPIRTVPVAAPPSTRSPSRPNSGGSASTSAAPVQTSTETVPPVVTEPTVDPEVPPAEETGSNQ